MLYEVLDWRGDGGSQAGKDAEWVMGQLRAMDAALAAAARGGRALGRSGAGSMTDRMRVRAAELGCHLGLLREGKLEWRDMQHLLPRIGTHAVPKPKLLYSCAVEDTTSETTLFG